MPFTFCHPAVIMPLARINAKRISITGLIIGSMSPDFEYFIKMRMEKVHGHSFAGLFYFDLPLTILLAFIYQLWVRDALIEHLPEVIKKNYVCYIGFDWISWVKKYWYVLIYSALIGIFSHVIWDAFTHTNGYFVQKIPLLQGSTVIFGVLIQKADFLQLMSSLMGGMVMLIVIFNPHKSPLQWVQLKQKIRYWILVLIITSLTLFLRGIASLGDFIATFIAGGLLGLILTPFVLKLMIKSNRLNTRESN